MFYIYIPEVKTTPKERYNKNNLKYNHTSYAIKQVASNYCSKNTYLV